MSSPLPRAEPFFFGPAERPCFGWLHRPPSDTNAGLGLVLCNPFGYEETSSHRSIRHFAEAAAALGVPALRFDYDGTGDSAGDDRDPGRWDAWTASVNHAADQLKLMTGVPRIAVLGIRLGAAIAATAAADRDDVAGLVAIAPILSGKTWLREAKAFQSMTGFPPPPPGLELEPGEQEVAGFVLTGETQASLTKVDLLAAAKRPAPEMLILDRDDLPADTRLADRMRVLGARVTHQHVPGYSQMMQDAHEARVPDAMIRAVTEWLKTVGQSDGRTDVDGRAVGRSEGRARASVAPSVVETPVFLDTTGTLFGILSSPQSSSQEKLPALILVNSGAIPHGGPSRLYVRLARRWAARGFRVLRFDVAGIGDSAPRPGEPENVVYAEGAVADVREALKYLGQRQGAGRLLAAGLCSGAYHAFKAAVGGAPIERVAIVNPLTFFWKKGMSLAYPPFHVMSESARYQESLWRLDKWKKVLSGGVGIRGPIQITLRRAWLGVAGLGRNIGRALGLALADDLGRELRVAAERGVKLKFIFSTGDPGEALLREGAGWALGALLRDGRVEIQRIEGPNHSFTPVWSQVALTLALETALQLS